jgi:predicted TPR repeat methyltransferase
MKVKEFYEEWAAGELEDPQREGTLLWKADVMADMGLAALSIRSILEIGCAEGIILNRLGAELGVQDLYGVELSTLFVAEGQRRYPHITFYNQDWESAPIGKARFDLLVLCDIIEHLPAPEPLLMTARQIARFVMFKLPVEKCLLNALLRSLGRRPHVGPAHPAGHLHEYTEAEALAFIKTNGFEVLNTRTLVTPTELQYPEPKLKRWYLHPAIIVEKASGFLPMPWRVKVVGGSVFALSEPSG